MYDVAVLVVVFDVVTVVSAYANKQTYVRTFVCTTNTPKSYIHY